MFGDTEDNVVTLDNESYDEEEDQDDSDMDISAFREEAREHKKQLEILKEKDPEFYKYMLENDKEVLEFSDDDIDEDGDIDDSAVQDEEDGDDDEFQTGDVVSRKEEKQSKSITMEMVESWGEAAREHGKIGAVRSLLKAYRIACHHGDDAGHESTNLHVMSSNVFNKVMSLVLSEMDGFLRRMMKLPPSGGKKETIMELKNTKQWKKYEHLVKSYLGNSLHVLNQMTDTEMVSFTLRRLKYSSLFLAAFPSLLRKYIKVALHFWGTGGGALPVVALLFLRDICIRLGSDCVDECFKGIYKSYVMNCHFINATKLQHVYFLANCVTELYGVDLSTAYLHAFSFIRQLAMILRDALNMKTELLTALLCVQEAFRKVYEWKFINCLELWTRAICAYGSEPDFRPLAYPLTQIIYGVARLVPTARYFPLRLRCIKMLNRIAASTNTFIPVAFLLLDMLDMKELNKPPTGGVGKAVDLQSVLKVGKPTVKTRAFQEACIFSVVEELAEHFAQWSYSVAFSELSFIPVVSLRNFCKSTKVERFRREMKELIRQVEANSEFINQKRESVSFLPNDPDAASFLEEEKKAGISPLSKYVATLRTRAQQRSESLAESSVVVGAQSSIFGKKSVESDDEEEDNDAKVEGETVFSKPWLPRKQSRDPTSEEDKDGNKNKEKKKRKRKEVEETALDEDIVEDLVLSSDDEGSMSDGNASPEEDVESRETERKKRKPRGKQRPSGDGSKKKKFQKKGKKQNRSRQ